MIKQRLKIRGLFFITLILSSILVKSQNTVVASGSDYKGEGGSISYSLGQVAFSAFGEKTGRVNEGVQQPYEIYVMTDVDDLKFITFECTVYPNPAAQMLYIKTNGFSFESKFDYQLFNIEGRLLKTGRITNKITEVRVGDLVASTYVLKVTVGNKSVKSFKIIKR